MNARRLPFQFSSTDPLARQRELEKRFGLQPTCEKMYIDVNNPLSMGTTKETSSPRLQHRVPIFAEGYNHPIYSPSVDSMASVPDKKPNVRVIPIEVEGADNRSSRHRTYSGPAGMVKDRCDDLAPERNGVSPVKRFHFEDKPKPQSPKLNAEPKVYNIPIKIEGVDDVSKSSKVDSSLKRKSVAPGANGCSQTKSSSKVKSSERIIKVQSEPNQSQVDPPKSNVEILLGKIEDVLKEFKTYETGVIEFSGTSKDKQYRYLDEMLTRCMLKLDDIDTMGNEEIRLARKNAVKKIQASIDLLESKANADTSTETPKTEPTPVENSAEMQDSQLKDDGVASNETSELKEMDLSVDDKVNTNESESKIEPTEMTPQQNLSEDVAEIEMSEGKVNNLSQVTEKAEDAIEGNSSKAVTEIEMSEEISPEVNSTNNAPLSETLSSSESTGKSGALDNTSDVDMLDENMISSVDEIPSSKVVPEENANNSTEEVTEVEMVEVGDDSSKDSGKIVKCETTEKTGHNSDCSVQEISHAVSIPPVDTEMKDVPSELDGDKSVTDQSVEQNDSKY